MSRYIDAEKIQFLPLSVKIGGNKYDVGAEPERMIMEIHDMVAYKGDIDAIPTANVEEVRHGEWISQPSMDDRYSRYYICSVCGRLEQVSHAYDIKTFSPYCHCGAKMDREKEKWQNLK